MSRFATSARLAAWAGLAPGDNESAGKRKKAATRQGSRHLRSAMVPRGSAAQDKRARRVSVNKIAPDWPCDMIELLTRTIRSRAVMTERQLGKLPAWLLSAILVVIMLGGAGYVFYLVVS
jgi:hypothetical protein